MKAVYGGKEGKITQNQQKIDILQLYENFGNSTGCGVNLAKNVANALVTIQEKESTEQVLSVLYKSLQACLNNIEKNNDIDQILVTALTKAAKATSSAGLFGLGMGFALTVFYEYFDIYFIRLCQITFSFLTISNHYSYSRFIENSQRTN